MRIEGILGTKISPPHMVQFGINALILATLAQSWNIIGGYTGYPSFGNSVFYGLGGYGVAIAMRGKRT